MFLKGMLTRRFSMKSFLTPALGMVAAATLIAPAHAQISYVYMFRSSEYRQTGNGNTLSVIGYFINISINSVNAGDFGAGSVAAAGSINPSLTLKAPKFVDYQSGYYSTQALRDSDFPTATYNITGTGGTQGPLTATLDYSKDLYPTQQPYLTGTGYSSLQGVNVHAPISLQFSSFASEARATQYQFFTIYDHTTNTFQYDAGFLPQTATGVTIPANTLTAGDSYTYELIDSNRVATTGTGATFVPFVGFDLRTQGNFIAGISVPEPCSLAFLVGGALSGLGVLARRRRAFKKL